MGARVILLPNDDSKTAQSHQKFVQKVKNSKILLSATKQRATRNFTAFKGGRRLWLHGHSSHYVGPEGGCRKFW